MMKEEHDLVTILTVNQLHQIHIAKSILKNSGIESYIVDENITSTIGTAFVQGYKLKVDETVKDQAEKILKDAEVEF